MFKSRLSHPMATSACFQNDRLPQGQLTQQVLRGKIKEQVLGRMDGTGATVREVRVDHVSAFLHTVSCSVVHSVRGVGSHANLVLGIVKALGGTSPARDLWLKFT